MQKYVALSVVAALVVLAAGWFLLVSPKRGEAAELRTQASSQQSANASLRLQLEVLREQAEDLPAQQARLAEIATKIPATPELPTLIRQLSDAAEGAGVDLVSLAPSPPQPVGAAAGAAGAAGGTPAPAPASTPAPAGTAGAPAAASSDLYVVPVAIGVRGGFFQIEQFFSNLEAMPRAVLVGQFTLSAEDGAEAAGDLTATVSGQVFLSPTSGGAPQVPAPAGAEGTGADGTAAGGSAPPQPVPSAPATVPADAS